MCGVILTPLDGGTEERDGGIPFGDDDIVVETLDIHALNCTLPAVSRPKVGGAVGARPQAPADHSHLLLKERS